MELKNLAANPGYEHFNTTRWSVIIASRQSRSEAEKSREALSQLCHIYWWPVHTYIRRKGFAQEDTMDLTQDFFIKILEPHFMERADRERGKFRALLLVSLENFLLDVQARERAGKRGGGTVRVSMEDWQEESSPRLAHSRMRPDLSAERAFDTRWAFTLSENALAKLRQECLRNGRERVFTELCPFLSAPAGAGEYEQVKANLGLRSEAVRVLVSRMRERYRTLLRAEVAETVEDERMIGEELQYLYSLLIAGREGSL